MAVTSDIVATYRGPGKVMSGLLAQGRNEVRVLMFALMAGLLIFVALSPYQARAAHLDPEGPLSVRQYWSAFFWIFIMPLLLYGLAAMVWAVTRVSGQRISGYAVRLTLVWSLLASAPLLLLLGLALGFIGPGLQAQIVGAIWLAVFFWFWLSGLYAALRA
ncbi:YIP1 family protein [Sulfitobacter sp. S0837]|uniref:YIP1 family protein n=1 Tax=Sulfitobacter maritimus TaxID=2741719 RepID=UPI0015830FDE|nr:YIP1 family protein [Sulfitobacter maritimus]NUH64226.1 YIP1 family protein [Sulfitobacter maritimus]